MTNKADVQRLIDDAHRLIHEATKSCIGFAPNNREAIQAAVSATLHDKAGPWDRSLQYTLSWTDVPEQLSIKAGNLFTALLLAGTGMEFARTYALVAEGSAEWQGCRITYRDGRTTVTPGKPAEFITIDFVILE